MLIYEYMTKEYYSTIEVAKIFNVSRITVFNWIKTNKIKALKVGRNFVIPHTAVLEKLGHSIGEEKKAIIDEAVDKALKDYEKTFKQLGKE